MADTQLQDVFDPEVASETATAVFPNQLAVRFPGSPAVRAFPPLSEMERGTQIKFPRWKPLGEFEDFGQGDTLTPEKLDTEQDFAVVQGGGKATEIDDWAELAAGGDPSEEAGRQMGTLAARYVDAKVIDELETTPLENDLGANAFSWDGFVDSIVPKWGDKAYQQVGALFVHSATMASLMKDDDFIRAGDRNLPDSMNPVTNGFIGVIGRYPVFVSDRLTTDGTDYTSIVVKAGAIGLKFQRNLLVERDRDVLQKHWVLSADVRFAVHLMYDDPSPALKIISED